MNGDCLSVLQLKAVLAINLYRHGGIDGYHPWEVRRGDVCNLGLLRWGRRVRASIEQMLVCLDPFPLRRKRFSNTNLDARVGRDNCRDNRNKG